MINKTKLKELGSHDFSMLSRSKCQKLLTFLRILPKTQDQEPISTKANSSPNFGLFSWTYCPKCRRYMNLIKLPSLSRNFFLLRFSDATKVMKSPSFFSYVCGLLRIYEICRHLHDYAK